MKKLIIFLILGVILSSCISTTKITGSWVNTKRSTQSYGNIFLVALTHNMIAKSTVETDLATNLKKYGVNTVKSIDEFTPTLLSDSIDRIALMTKVKQKNMDGVLMISLIKKETDSRYVSGAAVFRPGYYYGNIRDYYNYWYPCVYSPGYYITNEIYYIEANLYDANNQELVWSAQSQTYNPVGLTTFSKHFTFKMVEALSNAGILKLPATISRQK